ncbi:hypothetical protein [Bacillus sp. PDNC022]|uniref:hypothetical protein n=1 Tax=Bacillus sp. PDNC022 TaxID=2812759 RepID=UPI001965EE84|nr:hypothetical protein [Bacillus sp. PDNC022]QRY38457.1 hypothetical protein JVX94_05690 [Bacillus sp. PDNC022]
MKDKQIGVSHFVYVCIIALLIISFILVFAFGGSQDAGNQVNVMATGISIILAVIAIFMTLVDVAGQRQSIIDIKETAEKLAESQTISQETVQKSIETLNELADFRKELLKSVSDYRNGTEELILELFKKEEQSISKEELQELLNKLNRKTSDLESKVQKIAPNEKIEYRSQRQILIDFKQWVRSKYQNQSKIKSSEFFEEIYRKFSNMEISTIKNYILYTRGVYISTEENEDYIDLEKLMNVEDTRPFVRTKSGIIL